jgi:hypothetical protein
MSKILQCVDYGIYPQQHLFSLSNPTKHPADMSNLFSFAVFGHKLSTSLYLHVNKVPTLIHTLQIHIAHYLT